MTIMNKEEKLTMLFDIQEHPERYTDEQIENLLADEEVKDYFKELALARMAGRKAKPSQVDVDEAWQSSPDSIFLMRLKVHPVRP